MYTCRVPFALRKPIVVKRGETRGIYVHSETAEGKRRNGTAHPDSVVYGSQKGTVTTEDDHITILPGIGHTSSMPFSDTGWWHGNACVPLSMV